MLKLCAVIFTLIAPGSGDILTGNYTHGLTVGLLFVLGRSGILQLMLRALRVRTQRGALQCFYACNWFYIVLIFYALVHAFLQTKNNATAYFLYAVVAAICISFAYKKTFCNSIFTALCGRSGLYEFYLKNKKSPTEKK